MFLYASCTICTLLMFVSVFSNTAFNAVRLASRFEGPSDCRNIAYRKLC